MMKSKTLALNPVALAVTLVFATSAHAVGTGQIVNGSGGINKNQDNTVINQNTDKMIINWDNMNVGQKESLTFLQPNKNASVLNKISSLDPTVIQGAITANGNVFIVNPNGVLISKGAQVNVGSFIASSLDIKDTDFMKGNVNFSGKGSGKISNEGSIKANNSIALIGSGEVNNSGEMLAVNGNAVLAAGEDITLSFPSMGKIKVKINKGSLKALVNNGGIISTPDGSIALTAWATDTLTRNVINNTGSLEANKMVVRADGVYLESISNGNIDISGEISGNQIKATANNIRVGNDASLKSKVSTQLTANKKDGHVKFSKATLEGTSLGIIADNVLTDGNANDLTLVKAQQVNIHSGSKELTIGDKKVNGSSQLNSGKGIISEQVVSSISKSKGRLTIMSEADNITLDNSNLDYGNLTVNNISDNGNVNLLSSIKGDSLVITGKGFNQSKDAEINMAHGFAVTAHDDIVQKNNITAGDYISIRSTRGDVTQIQGVKNTAHDISFSGKNVRIDGDVSAQQLILAADKFSQGSLSSLTAKNTSMYRGDFDLTVGKNSLDEINLNANSLNIKTDHDTAFTGYSNIKENLVIDSNANVKLENLNIGGYLHVNANNIGKNSGYYSRINTGKDILLAAKNDINLYGINSGAKLSMTGVNVNAVGVSSAGGSVISSLENMNMGSVASRGENSLIAGRDLNIEGYLTGSDIKVVANGKLNMSSASSTGNLTITSGNDININNNLTSGGAISISGNNIYANSQSPWYPITFTSIKNIVLNAKNVISVGALYTGNAWPHNTNVGNVLITGNDIATHDIRTNGSLFVKAGNDVNLKGVNAEKDVHLNAGNDISLYNASSKSLEIEAGNDFTAQSYLSGTNVSINAINGSTNLHEVASSSDTHISAGKAVLINGDVKSGGSLIIKGESIETVPSEGRYGNTSTLSSVKDIILSATKKLYVGDISNVSRGWGYQNASGDIKITAGDITTGNINSSGSVSAKADNGIVTKRMNSADFIVLDAGKDIEYTNIDTRGKLKLSAGGDIKTSGITLASDMDISAGSDVNFKGLSSRGDLSISALGDINISGDVSAARNVLISGGNISIVSNSWNASGIKSGLDTKINSTGDINIGDISTGASYNSWNLEPGNISLVGKSIKAGKLNANGDLTILSDSTIEAGGVDAFSVGISAIKDINIRKVKGTDSVTATSSEGKIDFDTLNRTANKNISAANGVTIRNDMNKAPQTSPGNIWNIGQVWNIGQQWNPNGNSQSAQPGTSVGFFPSFSNGRYM